MKLFVSQWEIYTNQCLYHLWKYKIYKENEKQNYAWTIKTYKEVYGWGVIYEINFHFTNGWISLYLSENKFSIGEKSSIPITYVNKFNDIDLNSCREEAKIIWKMNGREPSGNLPFNYYDKIYYDIRVKGNYSNEQKNTKKESSSSNKNSSNSSSNHENARNENSTKNQSDMIAFYRNLLGLKKIRFTLDELKTAYREAARAYHPDKYTSASLRERKNAEILMMQINEAYEVLKKIAEE